MEAFSKILTILTHQDIVNDAKYTNPQNKPQIRVFKKNSQLNLMVVLLSSTIGCSNSDILLQY